MKVEQNSFQGRNALVGIILFISGFGAFRTCIRGLLRAGVLDTTGSVYNIAMETHQPKVLH